MFLARCFVYTILTCSIGYHHSWSNITVDSLKNHVQALPEFPSYEGENPLRPDYLKFLTSLYSYQFSFSPFDFSFMKNELTKALEGSLKDFVNKDNIQYIAVGSDDQIFTWGVLYGSLHSLVRELNYLKDQGILDDNLVLQHKNVKLVFMGDTIGGSAYSLETLAVILCLLNRNPSQVIFMRGQGEHHQKWIDTDFYNELRIKFANKNEFDSFTKRLNHFFEMLPSKIFFYIKSKEEMNAPGTSYLVLDSLADQTVEELRKSGSNIDLLIQNQNYNFDYFFGQGLIQKPSLNGIPTWSLVSALNPSFSKMFSYYQDAFYKITINNSFSRSTITHLSRDIHSPSNGFQFANYSLMSGKRLNENEVYNAEWLDLPIICTLDLTQSSKPLGTRLLKGIDLKIRQVNRTGGINGKLIRVNFIDDGYTPSNTVRKIEPFVDKNPFTLFLSPLGTPTTQALITYLKDKNYLLLFPYTGSPDLRQSKLKSVFHFRPSYADETKALIQYTKERQFKQKFAFFYQDDAYGHSCLTPARRSLLNDYKVPASQLCEGSYMRNSIDISKAASIIENCSPDVLFFFSTNSPSQALVNRLRVPFLSNITLVGISFLTDNFRNFLSSDKGVKFVMSRIVPSPYQGEIAIVKEYQEEFDRWYHGMKYDVDSLEGFINASLFVEVLKNVKSPTDKNEIINELHKLDGKNFKGLDLNYNSETREFSNKVWIDEAK